MPGAIYRFTRDLRLDDHAGLSAAGKYGDIAPVLVLDEALRRRLGSSARRAAFFCEVVAALDVALRERQSQLIVRSGEAPSVLCDLARELQADAVIWSASYDAPGTQADTELQSELEEAGIRASAVHDAPAIPPEESAAAHSAGAQGYRAFAPYFDVWRELEPASYEAPLLLSFAKKAIRCEALPRASDFGAEAPNEPVAVASREKLDRFLRTDGLQYAFALNVPADDRTSHLSADLTFGTISARTIVRETRARLDDPFLLTEERASLRLFLRSIAMRDFFLQLSWFNPHTAEEPLQEKMRDFAFARSHPQLDAWREGRTGYPLIDAGIRQLRATGWMHPRVRSIAASFLCFDLGVDWRVGMAEWERQLIEDDPALAAGNWQWIAGVGADLAAYPRIYNPRKQARRFDPGGAYVRKWIPELAHLSGSFAAAPSAQAQIELPLHAAKKYPEPIVDHETSARDFLKRYQEFTRAAGPRASR